jgi:hypothetical protein
MKSPNLHDHLTHTCMHTHVHTVYTVHAHPVYVLCLQQVRLLWDIGGIHQI